ncbi:MAG: 50S ribosomal protein L13 [Desulfomonilia bacterium]|jgi:large subunit ribosomal protein L13|uniref:50S ribosomal subunit protein L13 n=1 Tax=anaerobic digester metagenome TaxID=1263854 RepID=A0A485MCP9_9ZZZZ|nr:50S ribosomal protein L13 [Pseudomonadota bacterium]HON37893.1 50S ribosomal protein L13 [Deltaproteobacteria bacterium]HRS56297.1 50S ribosomal protein L13 [Desulfomonilia bacterium]HPD22330.1 50S ribosomal protein L13 [Deltaproteobacteria bacterium]HPX18213.1 50S ribosomal protein L13 [Deltaproteobacteria bacterium]
MSTFIAKKDEIERNWVLVDAKDKVLGRLAADVASILRGKTKPTYTPHTDVGDFVVIINAEKVILTGRKMEQKTYYRHSGYMGGLKSRTARQLMEKNPEEIIRHAVKGMLPKNSLGRSMFKKLKVYAGETHPHEAQKPKEINL